MHTLHIPRISQTHIQMPHKHVSHIYPCSLHTPHTCAHTNITQTHFKHIHIYAHIQNISHTYMQPTHSTHTYHTCTHINATQILKHMSYIHTCSLYIPHMYTQMYPTQIHAAYTHDTHEHAHKCHTNTYMQPIQKTWK